MQRWKSRFVLSKIRVGSIMHDSENMKSTRPKHLKWLSNFPFRFKTSLKDLVRYTTNARTKSTLMNLNKFFFAVGSVFILLASFIAIAPSLLTCDLITPQKIDSLWVMYHVRENRRLIQRWWIPATSGLKYSEFNVHSADNLLLGVAGTFLPQIRRQKYNYHSSRSSTKPNFSCFDYAKQFHDRGYRVCSRPPRSYGTRRRKNSQSAFLRSAMWRKLSTLFLLTWKETQHVVVMGAWTWARPLLSRVAVYDGRCAIVLQSPFDNFDTYIDRYAYNRWGFSIISGKRFWRKEASSQYPVKGWISRRLPVTWISHIIPILQALMTAWSVTLQSHLGLSGFRHRKKSYFWSKMPGILILLR